MEGISDIKIVGIDETRPPRILKEPYINLVFKLSHKAPPEWCDDYNQIFSKRKLPVKIDPAEGIFIETWVRKPEQVEKLFELMKGAVTLCSDAFIARIEAKAANAAAEMGDAPKDEGEQGKLNKIIAGLNFDD